MISQIQYINSKTKPINIEAAETQTKIDSSNLGKNKYFKTTANKENDAMPELEKYLKGLNKEFCLRLESCFSTFDPVEVVTSANISEPLD